jgi:hypothetical protein
VDREAQTDLDVLSAYARSLDSVFERSRELIATAPTWQASLYQSLRVCYATMRAHPEELVMHFMSGAQSPAVQRVRGHHRDRLLALLHDTRADAPPPLHAELLLSMVHATLRKQIAADKGVPDLDAAEHTFATVLFNYELPPQAHAH